MIVHFPHYCCCEFVNLNNRKEWKYFDLLARCIASTENESTQTCRANGIYDPSDVRTFLSCDKSKFSFSNLKSRILLPSPFTFPVNDWHENERKIVKNVKIFHFAAWQTSRNDHVDRTFRLAVVLCCVQLRLTHCEMIPRIFSKITNFHRCDSWRHPTHDWRFAKMENVNIKIMNEQLQVEWIVPWLKSTFNATSGDCWWISFDHWIYFEEKIHGFSQTGDSCTKHGCLP